MTRILPDYESPDGNVVLFNRDCRDVLGELSGVDAVVTDIPYNISQEHGGLREIDYGDWDKGFDWRPSTELMLSVAPRWCIWCGDDQVSGILVRMRQEHIARCLYWVKPNPTVLNGQHNWLPGGEVCAAGKRKGADFYAHCHRGWWLMSPDTERHHPNQKPLQIISDQVEATSREGGTVLDPFMGSGTAGVACLRTGRKFIGIEIDKDYYEIAKQRIIAELPQNRMPLFHQAADEQRELFTSTP